MNKILKYIVCLTLILPIITGCQALKDGLEGNKKTKRAEEFLIKKKTLLLCHQIIQNYLYQKTLKI